MQKLFKGFISLFLLVSSQLAFAATTDCMQLSSDGQANCVLAKKTFINIGGGLKFNTFEEMVSVKSASMCNNRLSCSTKYSPESKEPCITPGACTNYTRIEEIGDYSGTVVVQYIVQADMKWRTYGLQFNINNSCPKGYTGIVDTNTANTVYCKPPYQTNIMLPSESSKSKQQELCTAQQKGLSCNSRPVSLNSGIMTHTEVDYSNPISELIIKRDYNSITNLWTLNYNRSINYNSSTIGEFLTLNRDNGNPIIFKKTSGVWNSITYNSIGNLIDNTAGNPNNLNLYQYKNENNETEFYDINGNLSQIITLSGKVLNLTYSEIPSSGNLVSYINIEDEYNNKLTYTKNSDPPGSCSTTQVMNIKLYQNNVEKLNYGYSYLGSNCLLETVTFPDTKTVVYGYGSNGARLFTETDENGNIFSKWAYVYNTVRKQYVVTSHGLGDLGNVNKNTYTYPSNGTSVNKTDVRGNLTTITNSVTNGFLANTSYTTGICSDCEGFQGNNATYDSLGNLISYSDFNGNIYQMTYDNQSRLVQKTEAFGTPLARTTSYTWHLDSRLLSTKTELVSGGNRVSTYTYDDTLDANGQLVVSLLKRLDITAPNNDGTSATTTRTWKYYYNAENNVNKIENPRYVVSSGSINDKVEITYIDGNIDTMTNGLNQTVTFSDYNPYGYPQTIVAANGKTTTLTYDIMGRVLTSTYESTEVTTYEYDFAGQLTKVTYPTLNYNKTYYDTAHRLNKIEEYDENNNYLGKTEITLDNMSNVTAMTVFDSTDTQIRISTAQYDNKNRLFKSLGALNQTDTYTYDANSNLTSVVDAGSNTTTSTYDALNRLSTITYPDSGVVTTTYRPDDSVATVVDQKSLSTTYTYNGFGDLTKLESPDTGTTLITYDIGGNATQYQDNRNQVSNYTYDIINRLTNISYVGASGENVSITYDSCTNGIGKTCSITDISGTQNFTYDSKAYLATKEYVKGSFSKTVGYNYNSMGQLVSLTYPSGKVVNYTYENDKVKAISYSDGMTTTDILTNATYEAFNNYPNGFSFGNSATYSNSFNQDGLISSITSPYAYPTNKGYGFDTRYNITSITDPSTVDRSSIVVYDNKSRITDYTYGSTGNDYDYTYNSSDDRLTNVDNGATASTYNYGSTSHQLDSITGSNADSMTYDANGNILTSAGKTYTYNAGNRILTSNDGSLTTDYLINFNGYRTKKSNSTDTTWFIYDDMGNMIAEYDINGDVKNEYVYMDGNPVALIRNSDLNYIYTDHLGTPRAITDTSNILKWTWENKEAFGKNVPDENISGTTFEFNLRFPGQYYDKETELNYNVNRDYNPNWGRYVQSDPIGLMGEINTYGYVGGNSLRGSDELGLLTEVILARNYGALNGFDYDHIAIRVNNFVYSIAPTSLPLGGLSSAADVRIQSINNFKNYYKDNYIFEIIKLKLSSKQEEEIIKYYSNIADLSYNNKYSYSLFGNQCATNVNDVLNKSNINTGNFNSFLIKRPRKLFSELQKSGGYKNETIFSNSYK